MDIDKTNGFSNDVHDSKRHSHNSAIKQSERRRVYKPTESLLTRGRENENPYAEGLFNLATVNIMLLPIALMIRDLYNPGSLQSHLNGLRYLIGGPRDLLTTAYIFFLEFLIGFAFYFCFLFWAMCYRRVGKTANILFLPLLVIFMITYRYLLVSYLFDINFPPGARFACCLQQLFFIFKWVSFVYENVPKVLYPWNKEDESGPAVWYAGQMEPHVGSFSSYVYFLFCPVLLYRDRYPRKPPNLRKALAYFVQFIAMVWVVYLLMFEFALPKSMHRDDIRQVAVSNLFLGLLCLTCSHTFLLQCWVNCWAELLGFADRSFYEDWWNTRSITEYLRKWNPIMYDWLKAYVHTPLRKWLPGLPASVAKLTVMVLSALEHDFILSTGLGYFMPVYLVEYGICGMLLSMKPKMSRWGDQMTMCFCLSIGVGLQLTLYSTEVAAQIHCPNENAGWFSGLRMIDCYRHFNNN